MLATLMFSQGTPMLLAGDEFGRSQGGNNNAYCQDNPISWVNWQEAAGADGRALTRYVGKLSALRLDFKSFQSAHFLHGEPTAGPGMADLTWFDESAQILTDDAWNNPQARALAVRRAAPGTDNDIDITLLLINGGQDAIDFTLPANHEEFPLEIHWHQLLDSARPETAAGAFAAGTIAVEGHSVMLFANRMPRVCS
jgi:glycogen operon protein